ncbi:uncharacterized protein LOC125239353 [Leguminivora glycinivorella]|uniref:uncharacterized protein LOC125239353 n=1 Tax=Leguminivora glycinivorella TaxID=1035111 RepID=UPI00200F6151|nr:uncharacterized protein LOC125239353 [Leguminivora glycinivorella]
MNSFRYCCVKGCQNKTKTISASNLTFFRVPTDIERRRQWLTAIDRKDLLEKKHENKAIIYYYVCSDHFEDSEMIISRRLQNNAVPTKLPQNCDVTKDTGMESKKEEFTKQETYRDIQHERPPPLTNLSKNLSPLLPIGKSTQLSTNCHTPLQPTNQKYYPIKRATSTSPPPLLKLPKNCLPAAPKENMLATANQLQDKMNNQPVSKIEEYLKLEISVLSDQQHVSTQTGLNKKILTSNKLLRKRKLVEENRIIKRKLKHLESEYSKLKNDLQSINASLKSDLTDEATQKLTKLMDWQNKLKNKHKGNRYDAEYKDFALNLHYASPQVYRSLQTVMKLPNLRTLRRMKLGPNRIKKTRKDRLTTQDKVEHLHVQNVH